MTAGRNPDIYTGDIGYLLATGVEATLAGDPDRALIALVGLAHTAATYRDLARANAELAIAHPLTGLPNRRAMDQADQDRPLYTNPHDMTADRAEMERRTEPYTPRAGEPLSPAGWAGIMVDLDDFKLVNDVLGHETGDRMLVLTGHVLKKCIRKYDELYHFGGDEFAVFMPIYEWREGPDGPEVLGKKMRERFIAYVADMAMGDKESLPEGYELTSEDVEALRVLGASFAMSLSRYDTDRADLLRVADFAMSEAKRLKNSR